jgi:SPP1 gp7 family putative phage head morphogenesis protein
MDRKATGAQANWIRARKVENSYARQLRRVAKHIGDIVSGFSLDPIGQAQAIETALAGYARLIQPWAASVGQRMVAEVAARERAAWMEAARIMGGAIRRQIAEAPTGLVMRQSMAEQVKLITSLPTDAAERVHGLAQEAVIQGGRASEIAAEIMRSGDVSRSRADTIARTEVSRTQVELAKANAMSVGSTHFIWRTVGDSRVRESHRKLNGQSFRWDDPPESDPGHKALPGGIWNCRCWAEPVVPED